MPVNRFGKSRLESWEHPEATSVPCRGITVQISGARNSAGLRRSAAGVTCYGNIRDGTRTGEHGFGRRMTSRLDF
jgi:hypothetical protein